MIINKILSPVKHGKWLCSFCNLITVVVQPYTMLTTANGTFNIVLVFKYLEWLFCQIDTQRLTLVVNYWQHILLSNYQHIAHKMVLVKL